jgi:hypothetical protein
MPVVPLSSTFGSRAGSQLGSSSVPSKFATPVDRAVAELGQQHVGIFREPRLGVAHRGEALRIVRRAEVALAVDQRITIRERLRHQHERLVACRIAVRMELADHVADRARGFLRLRARVEAELAHRVDDAPLHRL